MIYKYHSKKAIYIGYKFTQNDTVYNDHDIKFNLGYNPHKITWFTIIIPQNKSVIVLDPHKMKQAQ